MVNSVVSSTSSVSNLSRPTNGLEDKHPTKHKNVNQLFNF